MATIKSYTKKNGEKNWLYKVYLGKDEQGKDITTTRRGFKTKREAQLNCNQVIYTFQEKQALKTQNMTFKELYDLFLESYRLKVKQSTIATTRRFIENYVLEHFGNIPVNKITVSYCQKIVNQWHEKYKQYAYFRKVTGQVLQFGIQMELITTNPMRNTILPRKKEEETFPNFYTRQELEHFFHCLEEHTLNDSRSSTKILTFFRVLAFTGLRKSEVLALQWEDINFFSKELLVGKTLAQNEFGKTIIQTPKTTSSCRKINLDDKTLRILREWRKNQKEWYLMLGFNTSSEKQFLFTNNSNKWYYPQAPNDWLYNILEKYNLPEITLHGFRHTHASLLFESGASIKEVQERLGHKDIKTTMNIYTHVSPEKIKETGEKWFYYKSCGMKKIHAIFLHAKRHLVYNEIPNKH